ncbi:MAG TPA: SUMF1/EgtB/PvdO family nonheme iron enzyme [Acidobacteriota bacterium]|nr:SUMF1/EgtB/PvdO family nonheme iron enzyme [Acidobacteriota bacterium]
MRPFAAFLVLFVSLSVLYATDLATKDVEWSEPDSVRFTLTWRNAWHNQRNHDAAWIFFKVRRRGDEGPPRHAAIAQGGIHFLGGAAGGGAGDAQPEEAVSSHPAPEGEPRLDVSSDRRGVFVSCARPCRGDVEWRLEASLDPSGLDGELEIMVFGLEMVYIPQGAFWAGDTDQVARQHGSFFRSDEEGRPEGLVHITSEDALTVGPEAGNLYYEVHTRPRYEGDQQGPVPAAFPKGFGAFYVMKYEITQGQYAAFLNTLGDGATGFRAPFGGRGYYDYRGSILLEDGRYRALHPRRPANFISWDDGCAFADWAALRPMTELEYTKAARGPERPTTSTFPWGTGNKDRLLRRMRPDNDLERSGEAAESNLSDETRDVLGASHYWVMDLAGSVWERVVSVGHPAGRAFQGSHGDGRTTYYGSATNDDWPGGDDNGGGYGYRGGGFYDHSHPEGLFNPHSPTGFRRFGAWGAAPRYKAYGFRAVRTAD